MNAGHVGQCSAVQWKAGPGRVHWDHFLADRLQFGHTEADGAAGVDNAPTLQLWDPVHWEILTLTLTLTLGDPVWLLSVDRSSLCQPNTHSPAFWFSDFVFVHLPFQKCSDGHNQWMTLQDWKSSVYANYLSSQFGQWRPVVNLFNWHANRPTDQHNFDKKYVLICTPWWTTLRRDSPRKRYYWGQCSVALLV